MTTQAYWTGLLVLVFGGFLFVGSSGDVAGVGLLAMVVGLTLGLIGILHAGIPERDAVADSSSR